MFSVQHQHDAQTRGYILWNTCIRHDIIECNHMYQCRIGVGQREENSTSVPPLKFQLC